MNVWMATFDGGDGAGEEGVAGWRTGPLVAAKGAYWRWSLMVNVGFTMSFPCCRRQTNAWPSVCGGLGLRDTGRSTCCSCCFTGGATERSVGSCVSVRSCSPPPPPPQKSAAPLRCAAALVGLMVNGWHWPTVRTAKPVPTGLASWSVPWYCSIKTHSKTPVVYKIYFMHGICIYISFFISILLHKCKIHALTFPKEFTPPN